ncbi:type I DNA topoisomerase [Oceanibacterium hippocampi]|uniref:DNA topoisomerase 1 n=1 Tax=Oceanibacterium hippocampi TaxID=745714 RepID=A0A1Y5SPF3_9PROT|nr:type I DNA topoisomerase [Oceanibacterium hippocampi]SLN44158.1 DNA topoisomerase 1 [Oceanibacterium hippocampi]
MNVVVVESPAKAKTINKYLGKDFEVLASYGHVRDLPPKDGSVDPDDDFRMTYEADPKSAKHLKAIADAVKSSDHLYLATDPDREGEAIAWHVLEELKRRKALKDVKVHRIVFNEITKRAVLDAVANPRELDMALVNAQQARRALDYLVGFTLSPVLWRKLPGAKSAGRVQSVALRLVVERELEIDAFRAQEYWTVEALLRTEQNDSVAARLTQLDGRKLQKFDLGNAEAAEAAKRTIEAAELRVLDVAVKPTRRNPAPPFTTSTLQQEASRKLGFGAKRTMQVAQKLYEGATINGETVGLITYMRTDGVQIANEAMAACREVIGREYGADYVPEKPRFYKTKSKNAQEAHEAVRPTDLSRLPQDMARFLSDEQAKLYALIWKRTLASQMESARLEQTAIDIGDAAAQTVLRATGSVVLFPGFLKLYEEGRDDSADDEDGRRLPKITVGTAMAQEAIKPEQHFTEPPPRYSEATLVKKLEELGIGRPSTYASILTVLQDRGYVTLDQRRFVPEDNGILVTAFLDNFFNRYVGYDFTANLEEQLDEVSAAEVDWKTVLRNFWTDFHAAVDGTKELRVSDVLEKLNEVLAAHIFPEDEATDGRDLRVCPTCGDGRLSLKTSRYGAFIGCNKYPECRYTRPLGAPAGGNGEDAAEEGPKLLGQDPESGADMTLRKGPYGHYLQLGEAVPKEKKKPKRVSIPKDIELENVDFALAVRLLSLPRDLGPHPETGKPIRAGLGRYGPYVECDGKYGRLTSTEEALTVGLNRAVDALAQSKSGRGRGGAEPLRIVGTHPESGQNIAVMSGRYGPYLKHDGINATLPQDVTPETVTMEQAVALLAAKAAASPKKKAGGAAKRKAPAKAKKATKTTKAAKTAKPAKARGAVSAE